jgi:hypothetical protein
MSRGRRAAMGREAFGEGDGCRIAVERNVMCRRISDVDVPLECGTLSRRPREISWREGSVVSVGEVENEVRR